MPANFTHKSSVGESLFEFYFEVDIQPRTLRAECRLHEAVSRA